MDELIKSALKIVEKMAETGDISSKAMLEYHKSGEKVSKLGEYIATHQKNEKQEEQIYEFLKSMNNLFDEFIKDLD
jgi:ERCC4-type nuclease